MSENNMKIISISSADGKGNIYTEFYSFINIAEEKALQVSSRHFSRNYGNDYPYISRGATFIFQVINFSYPVIYVESIIETEKLMGIE